MSTTCPSFVYVPQFAILPQLNDQKAPASTLTTRTTSRCPAPATNRVPSPSASPTLIRTSRWRATLRESGARSVLMSAATAPVSQPRLALEMICTSPAASDNNSSAGPGHLVPSCTHQYDFLLHPTCCHEYASSFALGYRGRGFRTSAREVCGSVER